MHVPAGSNACESGWLWLWRHVWDIGLCCLDPSRCMTKMSRLEPNVILMGLKACDIFVMHLCEHDKMSCICTCMTVTRLSLQCVDGNDPYAWTEQSFMLKSNACEHNAVFPVVLLTGHARVGAAWGCHLRLPAEGAPWGVTGRVRRAGGRAGQRTAPVKAKGLHAPSPHDSSRLEDVCRVSHCQKNTVGNFGRASVKSFLLPFVCKCFFYVLGNIIT